MKAFHFKDKIDSLPDSIDKIMPPIQIRIKPTNVCAHNCWYCAYRAEDLQLGQDMVTKDYIPREKMMEIIEDIAQMGVKSVTFSGGGDPFHYPYLLDAAKKLSETKVKFASLTHGARLEGELAEVFASHATWIRISIDGWNDKSYSEFRRVPIGEFARVIKNLMNFKKLNGKCYLGVCIIVDKRNFQHIYELTKRMNDIGVNSVKVAPCIVSNDGGENNEYHSSIFDRVKDEIARAQNDLAQEGFEIFDSYHGQLETFKKDYTWCPYLQVLPVIGADLNVYPCHDKAYNLTEGLIGSIKNIRFKDFWMTNKEKFFKINPTLHCNHHCVVNANNKMILDYLNADREHLEFV